MSATELERGVGEVLIDEERLQARIRELGHELSSDYEGRELLLVGREDRDELATVAPGGVLEVAHEEQTPTGDKLECDPLADAVLPDRPDDLLGIVETGGRVDLPAL